MPAGTTVRSYRGTDATVDVWCSTVFGLTGQGVKEIPIADGWVTMSVSIRWTKAKRWLVTDLPQHDGPEPSDAGTDVGQAPDL
ncbi:hypothetical protein QQM39_45530 [Streptomyces sp. DT2A-34]|uniref:hypothetical protein n=1 Tax=Streptomyces sp. DT2A-34 TaxID=3051182 RepID=UPI00265BA0DE|nr:hypothetical protein [Streptomyces sp. DT2A-34]MDO0917791.1 hypothetical protein [Streptomyces sp. DT2A-34]